ncbi:LamB/YcsF family protein [Thalassovita gelatinovora]|uniref:5-oxoprolinase subunit A n=1 Tax=Thalassovita gelatinovora TaxID=53501 RepID=A0A0P1G260_THAGE|nr:5-oxoprolinase subunit PxpA [Thalassovita gelatinovora]QIZ81958.1 5-oxoprolinase subunit PxpA [Thalassovita gelatinovora]CUH67361.1 LamB/YcsF family protein [Thalassovita gelatinovora]SEP75576.1 UPF0271 protein [Thalassovita gelatinovora]
MKINLNADLGESYGPYTIGNDDALLEIVGSANVACGLHGGDPLVMMQTVAKARKTGVSIGAHPGYADLHGFGRRPVVLPREELKALILYQLGAITGIASAGGHPITHVKPHGALNNQACSDPAVAAIVAEAVRAFDPTLILLAPVLSELAMAGTSAGLPVALEVFADRTYQTDGQLTKRSEPGSVLRDAKAAQDHVLQMIDRGGIVTREGAFIPTPFHSICVHGDEPTSVDVARAVATALRDAGHEIVPLPKTMT